MLCKVGGGRREWMGVPFGGSGSTARYRFVLCGWTGVRHPGGVCCWLVLCHMTRCGCCTLPSCGEWRRGLRRGRWYYLGAARRRRRGGWITEPPPLLCPASSYARARFPPLPIPSHFPRRLTVAAASDHITEQPSAARARSQHSIAWHVCVPLSTLVNERRGRQQ